MLSENGAHGHKDEFDRYRELERKTVSGQTKILFSLENKPIIIIIMILLDVFSVSFLFLQNQKAH